ncbi:MAG: carboxy terminal-processing peptidase [Planctomycetaceae bacterium]|jgi:carboxyl-terminal processing protease|nr:carboxy terminal-processing peptidase [Planctomycetaceae bacterium]
MRLRSVRFLVSVSAMASAGIMAGLWLCPSAPIGSGVPAHDVALVGNVVDNGQDTEIRADELKPKNALLRIVGRDTFQLMNQFHLSKKKFDSGLAAEGLKMYFRNLDPMKLYFYQSDIEEFSRRTDEVLKAWPDGKFELAFDIFNRYLKRVQENVALADEWIDADFDFTVQEELATDADLIQYCANEAEMKERWRQRIKYSFMLLEIEREENEKNMAEDPSKADSSFENISSREKLHRRYKALNRRMGQFIDEDVVELYLSAITSCYDPHTSYMSPTSYDDFMIQMRLNLEGIGATLQSTDDGLTTIKRIVPGGAADRSGEIKVDDKIVAVGQDTSGEMVDVTDMRLKDVVAMIRGKAGTNVRLNVLQKDGGGLKTISITREKIELTDSAARGKVFEQGQKPDGTPFKVGVIDLPSFYSDMEGARNQTDDFRSTTRDVQKLLDQFKQENVDSVVLDLRMNGGGSLREAIDCTGLFIDRGPIVQVKDPLGQIEQLDDTSGSIAWAGPLVVVTSKFSASASEILAGAIQDYNRGIVVGDPATHGKGTVQNLLNLAAQYDRSREAASSTTLGALKLTIQQFYRPGGDSTQLRGVVADVALPSITAQMDVAEGDLDYAMAFDQVPPARFTKLNMAGPDVVAKLTENSVKRRSQSTDFQRLERDIQRYVDQKQRKSVTLNKAAYLAEREEFNAEKQDEDTVNKQVEGPSTEIQRDFYLDEVLQIAADYSQMMKKS